MNEKNTIKPILFIFSGLPASGKSTLSKLLSKEYNAVYLRIDTITQGLQDLCNYEVQRESYGLSYRIASDNLLLGLNVVSDCCNPINLTRKEWESVAKENCSTIINIEVLCSNKEEHRKRYEMRDAGENAYFTWKSLENLPYDSWENEKITIDTANKSIKESFEELKKKIKQQCDTLTTSSLA